MSRGKKEDLPVHQLGANTEPAAEKPNLQDSELFPGLKAVKPDRVDHFDTRPGQTMYEGK